MQGKRYDMFDYVLTQMDLKKGTAFNYMYFGERDKER